MQSVSAPRLFQKEVKIESNRKGRCSEVSLFIQSVINGLNQGAIYALIALGYTMVYGIIRMINLAHGDFIMVGAY